MEKDLVCGKQIEEGKWSDSHSYQGKTYHFCSEKCRDEFRKSPDSFLKQK